MAAKKETLASRAAHVFTTGLGRYTDIEIDRARGVFLHGINGKRYLDFSSGIATTNTGHCHPAVVKAVQKQVSTLIHICAGIAHYPAHIEYAEELLKFCPEGLDKVFLCQTGTEAVEAALKLARFVTKKPGILTFTGAFHGRTLGSLSVTASKDKYKVPFLPLLPHVFVAPYPSASAARHAKKEEDLFFQETWVQIEQIVQANQNVLGAVIVEPIQGEGGYHVPHPRFLVRLREITKQYGLLLIVDEVQTGTGRTGKMFGFQHFGIVPDIVAMAKGLGSGLPLAAMIGRKDFMDAWPPSSHGSTLGGNPVCTAAGLATLKILKKENLFDKARRLGRRLSVRLRTLQNSYAFIQEVRGVGLMWGMEIVDPNTGAGDAKRVKAIRQAALEQGLLLISCGMDDEVIRFIPPLTISQKELDQGLSIFENAIRNH